MLAIYIGRTLDLRSNAIGSKSRGTVAMLESVAELGASGPFLLDPGHLGFVTDPHYSDTFEPSRC